MTYTLSFLYWNKHVFNSMLNVLSTKKNWVSFSTDYQMWPIFEKGQVAKLVILLILKLVMVVNIGNTKRQKWDIKQQIYGYGSGN